MTRNPRVTSKNTGTCHHKPYISRWDPTRGKTWKPGAGKPGSGSDLAAARS